MSIRSGKSDKTDEGVEEKCQKNPYASASVFSILTYSFGNRLINRIHKRGHGKPSDIYGTTPDLDTLRVADRIHHEWNRRLNNGRGADLFDIIVSLSLFTYLLLLATIFGLHIE